MPSSPYGHLGHLRYLRHWIYNGMPSSLCGHLGYLGYLGHLGYLSTISNLDTLNPYSFDTTLTDNYCRAFITEMDPKDPSLSKGYFVNNSPKPLPIATLLLPTEPHIRQTTLNRHGSSLEGEPCIRWIDAQMGMTQLDSLV
jgi:hypothetical protein